MINKIFCLPKFVINDNYDTFLESVKDEKIWMISILDSDADMLFPPHRNLLTLWFDDISPRTKYKHNLDVKPFTYLQANDIINFIYKCQMEINHINLIVHCSAGICRSGAVGRFANDYLELDQELFHKNNPNILPNEWVENLLWSVYYDQQREN